MDSLLRRLLPRRAWGARRAAPGSEVVPGVAPHGQWDLVDEASWESFPASDPPALNVEEPRTLVAAPVHSGRPPSSQHTLDR
jgi:hypothetical protein